jgi:hypothetical protein
MTTRTSRRAILASAASVPIAAAVACSPALADGDDAELLRLSVKQSTSTSAIRKLHGSAVPMRIPMAS